jgi:hypothetical protein
MVDYMKKTTTQKYALGILLASSGCLLTSDSTSDCYGLTRTDTPCVYQGTFAEGYECDKLTEIQYDFERLTSEEVTVECGATDAESVITIHKPIGTDCGLHFVGGCK